MSDTGQVPDNDADYSSVPIPPGQRMRRGPLTMAWWALCSAMFWMMIPAVLAQNFGAVNVLIGMALSAVVYALVNQVIVRYAIQTGLSVSLFSRLVFGKAGAELATLIFFATAIYYAVFEGSVIAVAMNSQFPSISLDLCYLLVVAYSVPLVFGSVQKWLDKLNGILLPFFLIGLVAAVVMALSRYGYSNAWLQLGPKGGAPSNGWWQCFTYFMGVWLMMMYTWDYARFGKQEDAAYHAHVNFGWVFYAFTFMVNACVGIFLVGTFAVEGGVTEVSAVLALLKLMGLGGLLFVWVTQTRINTANYYLSAVNMKSFFRMVFKIDAPRFVWALVVGAVVYVLMRQNVFSYILQALAYQGTFVVAWVAVALAHIASHAVPRDDGATLQRLLNEAPTFNSSGLLAWFAASVVGVVFMHAPGLAASFSAPVTAMVGAALYLVLSRRSARMQGQAIPAR